jgi:protochlorophyllide reductase
MAQLVVRSLLVIIATASSVTAFAFAPHLNKISSGKTLEVIRPVVSNAPRSVITSSAILFETSNKRLLQQSELPEKLYFEKDKESPKVLGGVVIGSRKLVVVTGASSGLGRKCAAVLAKTGRYYIIMAVRDVEKAKLVAVEEEMPEGSYTVMKLELGNLQSVRDFVFNLKAFKSAKPLDNLICNAAVYRPTDPLPAWTDDGFEMSMGVNHFGHFLLVNLLLDDMKKAKGARCCIVGSITGNTNTV